MPRVAKAAKPNRIAPAKGPNRERDQDMPPARCSSPETFERALLYIGMTQQQLAGHRRGIEQAGNGCSTVRLFPGNRKNIFKIDWNKL